MRIAALLFLFFGLAAAAQAQIDGRFLSVSADPSRPLFGYVIELDENGNDFFDCAVGPTTSAGVVLRITEITECPSAPNFATVVISLQDIVSGRVASGVYDTTTGLRHDLVIFGSADGTWAGYYLEGEPGQAESGYAGFDLSQATILVVGRGKPDESVTFIPWQPALTVGQIDGAASDRPGRCLYSPSGSLDTSGGFPDDCLAILETTAEQVFAIDRM
ncbi:hypothetical protein [Pararhodobacter aggregans]|uniref:hypothetical protein n=1 Tax=Pararhodobacter aggregans TaxID=404875 RepID=UPI003A91638B